MSCDININSHWSIWSKTAVLTFPLLSLSQLIKFFFWNKAATFQLMSKDYYKASCVKTLRSHLTHEK